MLDNDPLVDRADHRLHRMKPCSQYDKAGVTIDRQARIPFARNDLQQLLEPGGPLCSHNAELRHMRPQALISWVR